MKLTSLTLILVFSFVDSRFFCSLPEKFEMKNPQLYTKAFSKQSADKKIPLHRFLYQKGSKVGKGAFGEVKVVPNTNPRLVVKKVESYDLDVLESMKKEIAVLKTLCGKKPREIVDEISDCKSNAIAGFKGCVEEGNQIYIFQEQMYMDFSKDSVKKRYRALSGGKKAQVIYDIINKFRQIHSHNIVHSDIKPSNMMLKGKDFSDIRIVDFGMSGTHGSDGLGGSPIFLAPERHNRDTLSVQGDIYSLAISLAMLEKAGEKKILSMEAYCFISYPDGYCKNDIQLALSKAFSNKTRTEFLLSAFLKAADYNPNNRFQSMQKFAEKIQEAAEHVPGFGNNPEEKPKSAWQNFKGAFCFSDGKGNKVQPLKVNANKQNIII